MSSGSWSVASAVAVNQYDSGVITANTVSGGYLSAADPIRSTTAVSPYSDTAWAYDGLNQSAYWISAGNYVAFKPSTPWSSITQITVYTNMTDAANTTMFFGITQGSFMNYYPVGTTTGLISNSNGSAGNVGTANYKTINTFLSGTPLATPLSPNVGDPGTAYGTLVYSVNPTQIGDTFIQSANFGGSIGLADQWLSRYIAFFIKPTTTYTGFKYRFIIDYI